MSSFLVCSCCPFYPNQGLDKEETHKKKRNDQKGLLNDGTKKGTPPTHSCAGEISTSGPGREQNRVKQVHLVKVHLFCFQSFHICFNGFVPLGALIKHTPMVYYWERPCGSPSLHSDGPGMCWRPVPTMWVPLGGRESQLKDLKYLSG